MPQAKRSKAEISLFERYGTNPASFLTLFNPSKQVEYCRDVRRVHMGKAPTLGLVGRAYGTHIAETWLAIQLKDLANFSGCRDKMVEFQYEVLAETIRQEWGYFKITEFMLFFHRFKTGLYGHFYGSVDPLLITEALRKFSEERLIAIRKYEQQEELHRKEEDEKQHGIAVAGFFEMCRRAMMKPGEMGRYCRLHGMTVAQVVAETEELAWLFRMGYERPEPKSAEPTQKFA